MTIWKPGMRCVCIANFPEDQAGEPRKGDVGTVVSASVCDGEQMIELAEFPWPETDEFYAGFHAVYFRPLSETRLDIFRRHLAPVDRERADA